MGTPYRVPGQTTAPVAGATAGLWTFAQAAKAVFLHNRSGQTIYVRFNTASAASVADHDLVLATGASARLHSRDAGTGDFSQVGVWFPAAATVADFNIKGV